jgi:ATPase subunit of ABC transporter with duplicated ATPase domains
MNIVIDVKGKRASGRTTFINWLTEKLESFGATVTQTAEHQVVITASDTFLEPVQQATNQCTDSAIKPQSALAIAHQIVHGDREQTYGDAGKNFRTIAAYWSTHLKAAYSIDVPLTEADVCGMMVLLKQARLANDPSHRDSKIDIAGYTELNDIIQQSKAKS